MGNKIINLSLLSFIIFIISFPVDAKTEPSREPPKSFFQKLWERITPSRDTDKQTEQRNIDLPPPPPEPLEKIEPLPQRNPFYYTKPIEKSKSSQEKEKMSTTPSAHKPFFFYENENHRSASEISDQESLPPPSKKGSHSQNNGYQALRSDKAISKKKRQKENPYEKESPFYYKTEKESPFYYKETTPYQEKKKSLYYR